MEENLLNRRIIRTGLFGAAFWEEKVNPEILDEMQLKMIRPTKTPRMVDPNRPVEEKFFDFIEELYDTAGVKFTFEDMQVFKDCHYHCAFCVDELAERNSIPVVINEYALCSTCAKVVETCSQCGDLFTPGNSSHICDVCYYENKAETDNDYADLAD